MADQQRAERDREATRRHDERVAAGERLILARAATGDLISYRPEEYGFVKSGAGRPQVKTVWGAGVVTAFLAGFGILTAVLFAGGVLAGDDVPWEVWFVPLLCLLLCWVSSRYLRQEWRARRLRKERGVPRPLS